MHKKVQATKPLALFLPTLDLVKNLNYGFVFSFKFVVLNNIEFIILPFLDHFEFTLMGSLNTRIRVSHNRYVPETFGMWISAIVAHKISRRIVEFQNFYFIFPLDDHPSIILTYLNISDGVVPPLGSLLGILLIQVSMVSIALVKCICVIQMLIRVICIINYQPWKLLMLKISSPSSGAP